MPRMWLWEVAILVSLPIGGYIADLVVNGVDSLGAALAGGLIVGAVVGAAEWFAIRQRVSWLWIPATITGMAWAWSQEPPWSVTGQAAGTSLSWVR